LVDPALGFQADSSDHAHFEQNRPSWVARTFWSIRPLRNAALSTYGTNPLSTRRLFRSFVSRKEAVTDARVRMLQQPLSIKNTTNAQGEWLEMLLVSQDTSLASDFSRFQQLHMPVLVNWGASDTVTPLWQGKQLQALIPNSQLSVIEGVGHIPYIENADAFNNTLLQFLGPRN
jgi:pimeloyl-ACP methyl ester carboxylesterase